MAIPNSVADKADMRNNFIASIPIHVANIFNSQLSKRFRLVIQHGADRSKASELATELIKNECAKRNIPYYSSSFFYNGNSIDIQEQLRNASPIIQNIFTEYIGTPDKAVIVGVTR